MHLVEDFSTQYLSLRSQDTLILGTHQKFLSYQHNYDYMEVLKFQKDELMILAEAHKANLDEKTKIQLYEITDGIPLFAYLLLKAGKIQTIQERQELKDIYAYLKEYIISSLSQNEQYLFERIALLSLSASEMKKDEFKILGLSKKEDEFAALSQKGLIQYSRARNDVSIPKAIAKSAIVCAVELDEVCTQLYKHYKSIEKNHFAVLYLLLTDNKSESDRKFLENNLRKWLNNNDILSLLIALEPSIDLSVDIKMRCPSIYVLYLYASICMYSSCGEYPRAKALLSQLQVDGKIIQRYSDSLDNDNFNLHFIWADIEHLLNNYDGAIDIIDSLIGNSECHDAAERLPKLYWMKAHCLRHQASNLEESLSLYRKTEEISLEQRNNEYMIRALHGQICISLICADSVFDYQAAFLRLDEIYAQESDKWSNYQYNTFKYKSIYLRIYETREKAKADSLSILHKALDGFTKMRKRNIYDIYFEFGEYFRYFEQYEESIDYYSRCIEFAKHNTDYNLESLAELGLILSNSALGKGSKPDALLKIIKEAQHKNLNLSISYAKIILEFQKRAKLMPYLPLFNP